MHYLLSQFYKVFRTSDEKPVCCFAPGRINLIGEHIDYNGGPVMPFPIENGTYMLFMENGEHEHRFFSLNFPETVHSVPLSEKYNKHNDLWINYPLGSIQMMMDAGYPVKVGFDFFYYGDIPNGAGMSSSASIEVVTLYGLNEYFKYRIDLTDIVKLARKAENDFVGVSCGIMDQYAVAYGKKDHVILLDCDTPEHRFVKADLGDHELFAINTSKKRGLMDSKYNERYSESMQSLEILKDHFDDLKNLCELDVFDLPEIEQILAIEDVLWRRTRHVINETERVFEAIKALERGDMPYLGALMNASHHSLQYDYESTGFELDALVSILQEINGIEGARVTGGGFGGCAIALAKKGIITEHKESIVLKYKDKTGLIPEFYPVHPSMGVHLKSC